MPRMIISPEGVQITERYFLAVNTLRRLKKIRGLQTITREMGANQGNVQTIKASPSNHVLKPELLSYLVLHYGVSADWLLTGRGEMLPNEKQPLSSQTTTVEHV